MAELQDPLASNISLGGVKTTLPLLPEQDYVVQCKESTVDPNKKETGHNWNLRVETVDAVKSVDDRDVAPGFPFFMPIALQPAEDAKDPEGFKRNIASAIDAFYGTDENNRPDFSREIVDGVVGKPCIASVYIDTYQGEKRNKVRRLKPLPQ